jgi:hypothetical protein
MMFLAQFHVLTFVPMFALHVEPTDRPSRAVPLLSDFGTTDTTENYLSSVDIVTEYVAPFTEQNDH